MPFQVGSRSTGSRRAKDAEARPLEPEAWGYHLDIDTAVDSSQGIFESGSAAVSGSGNTGCHGGLPDGHARSTNGPDGRADEHDAGDSPTADGGADRVPHAPASKRAGRFGHQDVRDQHGANAALQRGGQESRSSHKGARTPAREADADDRPDAGGTRSTGPGGQLEGNAATFNQGIPMQVRGASREATGEEGGVPSKGKMVLEVRPKEVRLLRVT